MSKTLFLSPPSFDGFDGGAGARYQAKREIRSFWYPTWLAQPAALVPNSKLMDCPPHDIDVKTCLAEAKNYDHVIIHTSTPSLRNDAQVAEAINAQKPATTIGFVGAHAAVLPTETLKASPSIDWVGRKEFDFTCKEVAEGRPLSEVNGLSHRRDDTVTANLPRARDIAQKLKPLGMTWSCNSRANVNYETIKLMKECGLRLFLVGYESGNQQILDRIKKGINIEEAKQFTKACKELGVIIHGTFILGLPVETRETIEQTIRYAMELDVFSIQVSLAAPYPGTELYEMARQNGWFAKKDKTDIVHEDGFQQSSLEYPGLSKEEIFEAVDRFYRAYYLRPKPILRIIKTMLEDKDVCVRRCREGYEFFKSLRQRKVDLASSRALSAASATA